MVGKLVLKMGKMVQAWVILYKAVVQLVLLCRSESWVLTGEMVKLLEGFHHRVARMITGVIAQRTTGREW